MTNVVKVLAVMIAVVVAAGFVAVAYEGSQPPGPYDGPSAYDDFACYDAMLPLLDGPEYDDVWEVAEAHPDWPNGWVYALFIGQVWEREGLDDPEYVARQWCGRWHADEVFPDFHNGENWEDIEDEQADE